jgi:hypothetical protein
VIVKKVLGPAALALCLVIALAMAALKPVPNGHRYDLAVQLTLGLCLLALFAGAPARRAFSRGVRTAVFIAGIGLGALNLASIGPDAEIVAYYRTAFAAMDAGANPYTAGTIWHLGEGGTTVYGNFNYPPGELIPYYLAYRVAGHWDRAVLVSVMILMNGLCCVLLILAFPTVPAVKMAAFFPLFLLGEIRATPSIAFLAVAVLVWLLVREERRPSRAGPYLIALAFGIGATAKFLVWPLMGAYYWHRLVRPEPGRRGPVIAGGALALGTSALIMAPFGIGAVVRNVLFFNVELKERAALTTFYPNVVSGPLEALGLGSVFAVAAVAVAGGAILAAPRFRLFPALLLAAFAFLLAAPTPEPQFLPAVLYLAVAYQGRRLEEDAGTEDD